MPASRCWRPANAAGLCLVQEPEFRTVYMFNHLEYDTYTLHDEYCRDRARAPTSRCRSTTIPTTIPRSAPRNCWRAYAHLLFGNWINEMYQTTPYDLAQIGAGDQAYAA